MRFQWFVYCIFVLCVMAVCMSCDRSFDPRGALDRKPVVYALLSSNRDVQYVRVEQTYMPVGFDPLVYTADNFVPDAVVTISTQGVTTRLRDTMLVRSDTSRFKFPLRAYVIRPMKPTYGASYVVRVETSGFGTASQAIVMPTKPAVAIDASSIAIVDDPAGHPDKASMLFPISLGVGAFGFRGRMFVDYEVLIDGEWIAERVEIPASFASSDSQDIRYVIYPQFTRATSSGRAVGHHLNLVYQKTLSEIAYTKYPSTKIVFNRVVYQLSQIDKNLYNYYLTTHSFEDPHSTRLDEPFFSGVAGGVGVIGAYTVDSLVHILPENFVNNRW